MTQPIRSDVTRAHFNRTGAAWFSAEVLVMSIGIGFYFGSILAGVLALIGFAVLVQSPLITLAVWLLSFAWAGAGYGLGKLVALSGASSAGLGLLAFVVAFGIHHTGAQYIRDVGDGRHNDL
jgi:hypothetical protein